MQAIKVENTLLRRLNEELVDKNLLLKELVNKHNNVKHQQSYFDAVKSTTELVAQVKIPNIIITAKREEIKKMLIQR